MKKTFTTMVAVIVVDALVAHLVVAHGFRARTEPLRRTLLQTEGPAASRFVQMGVTLAPCL
jgi:hypothetical protein